MCYLCFSLWRRERGCQLDSVCCDLAFLNVRRLVRNNLAVVLGAVTIPYKNQKDPGQSAAVVHVPPLCV
ncbi:hypothetical protein MTO96_024675 [Rhipicephalus appendiculatus]